MKHQHSRRTFLFGAVGGAVSVAGLRELVGPVPGSRGPVQAGSEAAVLAECCPHPRYTVYDGWIVTVPDKRFLAFPVRFTEGWYPEERNRETTWRWSGRTARLVVPNPGVASVLRIEYDGMPDLFPDGPRTLTVSMGDRVLHSALADAPGRRSEEVSLGAGALGDGEVAEIELAVDRTFVPAARVAGSRDSREMGLRVYGVEIREASR